MYFVCWLEAVHLERVVTKRILPSHPRGYRLPSARPSNVLRSLLHTSPMPSVLSSLENYNLVCCPCSDQDSTRLSWRLSYLLRLTDLHCFSHGSFLLLDQYDSLLPNIGFCYISQFFLLLDQSVYYSFILYCKIFTIELQNDEP